MIIATRRRNSNDKTVATDLTGNCTMLLRTPQMLKKSGINKGNAMNYLVFIVRIVHVGVKKQSAVKPCDAIGGKEEEPALIVVSPHPSLTNSSTPKNIFSYFFLFFFNFI